MTGLFLFTEIHIFAFEPLLRGGSSYYT